MVSFDVFTIKAIWGNMLFDFATSSARGQSGGILCVWDNSLFHKKRTFATDHCLCVEGTWLANNTNLLFISVYSPQELPLKRALWTYMAGIINCWHGEVIIMEDFNEVRYPSERYGSSFNPLNAAEFNRFIANSHLFDIPLGGYSFTWSDKYASKMSKLDRFLVSQGTLDLFPNLTGLILHCNISDHRPILLKEAQVDYGPTPFRLYHSWFLEDDFQAVIVDSWNNDDSTEKRRSNDHTRKSLQDSFNEIKLRIDKGECLPDDLSNRVTILRDLNNFDQKDAIDWAQKAKIKWAIEGDKNSKFFHRIVNKKRRHLAIKGILVNGEWIDNPSRVKSEFYNYFSDICAPFEGVFPKRLAYEQSCDLEEAVSNEEIKRAIWDCGSDKSPGPDGFTFEFFKKYWSVVGNDIINAVKEFFITSSFLKGCNSSFITLIPKVLGANKLNEFRPISLIGRQYKIIGKILANRLSLVIDGIVSQEQSAFIKGRQIMDGPLILNELISWCKAKKDQCLLLKVDFQKAFDSVRSDHLDEILGKFGFGNKWHGWIRGCLISSKASILLIDRGLFVPTLVGKENPMPISHLFYADDAMFISKWSCSNVCVLMMMLHCFFLASGLKVNVHKSSLYGVGVHNTEVQLMAASFGYLGNKLPFTYLGVKVGGNMTRANSWTEVVQKVSTKLSSWKAKSLSVGGRLTLIKSVLGAIPIYYMSMFKVLEGILSQLEKFRNSFFLGANPDERKITWWIWRFLTDPLNLWIRVIKFIHGNSGGLENLSSYNGPTSTWSRIVKATIKLKETWVDLMEYCKLVIELQKDVSVAAKLQAPNIDYSFRRAPRSGIELSQFLELVQLLNSVPSLRLATAGLGRYMASVCFLLNRLEKKSISMSLLLLLRIPDGLSCTMTVDLVRLFGRWWNIQVPHLDDPSSWDLWFKGLNLSINQKRFIEASFVSMWWHIWKFRNASLFSLKKPRKAMIFDDIVSHTFFWVNSRCSNFKISMDSWLIDPLNAL
ncbi:RNA-directed DNA polymerase, eukaryota [Tanacetum coccineum]